MNKVYNGFNLLSLRFNPNNINLYGTALVDKLFSKEELATGQIEPGPSFRTRRNPLDQERVNLIKICYLKKVRSFLHFSIEIHLNFIDVFFNR